MTENEKRLVKLIDQQERIQKLISQNLEHLDRAEKQYIELRAMEREVDRDIIEQTREINDNRMSGLVCDIKLGSKDSGKEASKSLKEVIKQMEREIRNTLFL